MLHYFAFNILDGKQVTVMPYIKSSSNNEEETENYKKSKWKSQEEALRNEEDIAESGRIFIRNLSYTTTENDIEELFSKFGTRLIKFLVTFHSNYFFKGPISELNLPIDSFTRKMKGFGTITFLMPEHAVKAYTELDGTILHGRMLHLLPGISKDSTNDDNLEGNYKETIK